MALLRSIATVGGYTLISRFLGFARDILIAATLGAGPIADAFFDCVMAEIDDSLAAETRK